MKKEEVAAWKKRLKEIEERTIEKPPRCTHPETFVDSGNGDIICASCYRVLEFGKKQEEEDEETIEAFHDLVFFALSTHL
ncbi:MAG: hypothetical protein ABSB71_08605 [Candidatus Bathyarchaeia archaeon]|jgi:hypothetical protein